MIIPSIDLMGGHAVQLVGGKKLQIDAGDPLPIAERFKLAGEIAVVDLDAALGKGSNREVITHLLNIARCRVGGGIRDIEAAIRWLDLGAHKIVLGTSAVPEVLSKLPRERLVAALDAVDGEVVVEGWQTKTGRGIEERMQELRPWVGEFLVTMVEREGRQKGADMPRAHAIIQAAGEDCHVTIAGGVTTAQEVAELDRLGADAQVGMALYTNRLPLADAIVAPLSSDRPDGLWPTIVASEHGEALGLAYSNLASVSAAIDTQTGVYHSRTRGLWQKGKTSGATQELLKISVDCDRDALRFTVRQRGEGFCHRGTHSCFGDATGLALLEKRLRTRVSDPPAESYTKRLLEDNALLSAKLLEEAQELVEASSRGEIIHEAADLVYFMLAKMAKHAVTLADVETELDRRRLRVTRRPGHAKPWRKSL
ncbi:MAG: phosphoribosyl-ATP diphosphatase [Myxococcales bacterium]|nr:phosphoribosyl-ATP diphosphatase [Myxococcales bacterium]MCB9708958.1 phosphoribosyl-ATP diphosphatase [Myxococcales bacterium]